MTDNFDNQSARNEYRLSHEVNHDSSSVPSASGDLESTESTPVKVSKKVSVINWFFTIFICYIPVINIITLLIWAFSNETNPNKKSFAKAKLVWIFIELIILVIVAYFAIGYIREIMQL